MVSVEAPRREPVQSLSRKEYLKAKKNDTQLFENTLLCAITFPKRHFLGRVRFGSRSLTASPLP